MGNSTSVVAVDSDHVGPDGIHHSMEFMEDALNKVEIEDTYKHLGQKEEDKDETKPLDHEETMEEEVVTDNDKEANEETLEDTIVDEEGEDLGNEDVVFDPSQVVSYQTHIQNEGWQSVISGGEISGFPGEGLRLEGLMIETTMNLGLTYVVHIQNIGWQEPRQVGELAGTTGESKRIEAISIILVSKEEAIKYTVDNLLLEEQKVHYTGHVQNIGWQEESKDRDLMGTIGQGLRLEALDFSQNEDLSILHSEHVANLGWTEEKGNKEICGTVG